VEYEMKNIFKLLNDKAQEIGEVKKHYKIGSREYGNLVEVEIELHKAENKLAENLAIAKYYIELAKEKDAFQENKYKWDISERDSLSSIINSKWDALKNAVAGELSQNMSFSQALAAIKDNKKVTRSKWNNEEVFIQLKKKPYLISGKDLLRTSQLFIQNYEKTGVNEPAFSTGDTQKDSDEPKDDTKDENHSIAEAINSANTFFNLVEKFLEDISKFSK
jgi:hypothetical protein